MLHTRLLLLVEILEFKAKYLKKVGCRLLTPEGIDYTHEAFRDSQGNSRILAIWDQTIQDGDAPEGFHYGTVYTREDINRALQADDPYSVVPSRDENGHGSAMAGVAAGSGLGNGLTYVGAAPDADIVVVKLKEAKQYLRDHPEEAEKLDAAIRKDFYKLMSNQSKVAARAAGRPVDISADDFDDGDDDEGGAD